MLRPVYCVGEDIKPCSVNRSIDYCLTDR